MRGTHKNCVTPQKDQGFELQAWKKEKNPRSHHRPDCQQYHRGKLSQIKEKHIHKIQEAHRIPNRHN